RVVAGLHQRRDRLAVLRDELVPGLPPVRAVRLRLDVHGAGVGSPDESGRPLPPPAFNHSLIAGRVLEAVRGVGLLRPRYAGKNAVAASCVYEGGVENLAHAASPDSSTLRCRISA